MIRVLGIETSCDETAASVVEKRSSLQGRICSNIILSQVVRHAQFGGVVPEIAARAHVEGLDCVIESALRQADLDFSSLDAVAATAGPGLIGGLIVGLMTGKALAAAQKKPFFAINHLEGHALVARLTHGLDFPYLLLLVSGGHTQILLVRGVGCYQRWATTLDDALGEAFDKVARMLNFPCPTGISVEKAAMLGDPCRFSFPRPMKGSQDSNFSFSGLKTAVWRMINSFSELSEQDVRDLCASFQQAVIDVLRDRVLISMERFLKECFSSVQPKFVVAGGVASNQKIRYQLEVLSSEKGFQFVAPAPELCSDNAAMIAWAAIERFNNHEVQGDSLDFAPRSRWPLDLISDPMLGSGRRGAKA